MPMRMDKSYHIFLSGISISFDHGKIATIAGIVSTDDQWAKISPITAGGKTWAQRRPPAEPPIVRFGKDEIDEFETRIYEASLLIPKSPMGIKASVQIYGTMREDLGAHE